MNVSGADSPGLSSGSRPL